MIRTKNEAAIAGLVAEFSDATLKALREMLADSVGMSVSNATL